MFVIIAATLNLVIAILLLLMGVSTVIHNRIPLLPALDAKEFRYRDNGKKLVGLGFIICSLIIFYGLLYPFIVSPPEVSGLKSMTNAVQLSGSILAILLYFFVSS